MSQIAIDKDVPPPPPERPTTLFPFNRLEVGDSVFFPNEGMKRIGGIASAWGKRHGIKLTCSTRTENGTTGIRVWRVS